MENTPVPTALIAGVVVDGVTGRPIPGALVDLDRSVPKVFADALGRFAFPGIRPAVYEVRATKPGYAATESDGRQRRITVIEGQRKLDVRIKLWRLGSLNGRVTDDRGDPIVGAEVGAFRWLYTGNNGPPSPVTSARSDDRGVYRLFDLLPGDYLIAASRTALPSIGDVAALAAPTSAEVAPRTLKSIAPLRRDQADGTISIFPPRFYAGAQTFRDAMIVPLAAGDDRLGLDLRLSARPVVGVSGTVITGGASLELKPNSFVLTPVIEDEPALGLASYTPAALDANGGFTFDAVPHGNYLLTVAILAEAEPTDRGDIADRVAYWASLPVTVAGDGVTGLQLVMRPGVRLSGSLSFVGGARPTADAIEQLRIMFVRADGRLGFGAARVEADGSFAVLGLVPGRYSADIEGSTTGLHVKSVSIGGMDVTDSPFTVGTDSIVNLKISVAGLADYATISGSVPQTVGSQAGLSVLLFPADRRWWQEPRTADRRFRVAETDARGAFAFTEIVPGEYFVIATEHASGDWRSVARLDALARNAARLAVSAGESRVVTVIR